MKIHKNDTVIVVAGNNKGSKGKVLKVFPKENRVIIESVNIHKRSTKPNQKNPQGGFVEKEAPINVSNVMVVDPKSNEPTRIGKKVVIDDKNGKKIRVRVSKLSGEMLDK